MQNYAHRALINYITIGNSLNWIADNCQILSHAFNLTDLLVEQDSAAVFQISRRRYSRLIVIEVT